MPTLDHLRIDMQEIHARTQSWQKVGDCYGINKALARLIANGYEPGRKARKILGLPAYAEVIVISGEELPAGAQVISASFCRACGRPFISNHPRRKKCFICGPYRKRP